MKYWIVIILFFLGCGTSAAYSGDTASAVQQRSFDPEALADAAEDYAYEDEEIGLWARFMKSVSDFLSGLGSNISINRYVLLVIGIIILGIAIFYIMKMQKLWIFSDDEAQESEFESAILQENIHDMDFERLILEAEAKQRFNVAVRLLFLKLLKQLSDREIIHWDVNKTNREYYYEISDPGMRSEYDKVSDYFERAWYGEYFINDSVYSRIKPEFTVLSKRLIS